MIINSRRRQEILQNHQKGFKKINKKNIEKKVKSKIEENGLMCPESNKIKTKFFSISQSDRWYFDVPKIEFADVF